MSIMHRYDVRASDLDRERAVEFLKAHYAAGRLQHEELALRSDAAYRAVRLSELDWLTGDLPALVGPPQRRSHRGAAVAAVAMFVLFLALLVVLPSEVWLALFALAAAMGLVAFVVLAPIAIPVLLLAWVVHMIVRAARPQPRRAGWR